MLPVRVSNADAVVGELRTAGFDATRLSSLSVVDRESHWLNQIVYVPGGDDIPESEWRRQAAIVRQVAQPVTPRAESELFATAECHSSHHD